MLSLYQKIHALMEAVPRIAKDKTNTGGGNYKYASEEIIKETLHPLLVEHRLLFVPSKQTLLRLDPPSGDKKMALTTISCTFLLIDVDTGATLPIEVLGSGSDSADKGIYKAITGALKYALTTLLVVPTGSDPERKGAVAAAGRQQPQRKQAAQQNPESLINDAQRTRLYSLATAHRRDKAFMSGLLGKFGYESSTEVKAKDYEAICAEVQG